MSINHIQESIDYSFYLYELLNEQYTTELILSEAVLFESGYTLDDFNILHENVIDKIKENFKKLMDKISSLWSKFKESVLKSHNNNIKFIQDNKNIILNTPLAKDTYTMNKYWGDAETLLFSTEIPKFNFNMIQTSLESDEKFIKTYFKDFVGTEEQSYVEVAKEKFRGPKITIESDKFPIAKAYEYCSNYKENADKFDNELNELDKASKEVIKRFSDLEKASVTKENYVGDLELYSYIKEQVLIYEKLVDMKSKNDSSEKSEDNKENETTNTVTPKTVETKKDDGNIETIRDGVNKIQRYIKICYNIIGAKKTVLKEAYDSYMYIIREHVSNNTKSDKKEAEPEETQASKEELKSLSSSLNDKK